MATYSQDRRPLKLSTPLGPDVLLLVRFEGHEAMSELFRFEVEAVAERRQRVEFERLLGQPVLVEHQSAAAGQAPVRCVHGIVNQIGELGSDDTFTRYRLQIVPALWLLSVNVQCRIFQQQSVPDILRQVLHGLEVSFQLQGTYLPHNYCVQYGESDFHFASRLMEEEGIYYYFEHSQSGHRVVLADRSADNPELPHQPRVRFDPAADDERRPERIDRWQKFQELRPGRYTLWDHSFELPGYRLDASAEATAPTQAGSVVHDLGIGLRKQLEVFEYPGDYAHRFDAIGPNGEPDDEKLQAVFSQNVQTVQLRLQEQLAQSLRVDGTGTCPQFTPGYRFRLEGHPHADGEYLLTSVEHSMHLAGFRGDPGPEVQPYRNRFTCLPHDLAYRPPRRTPRSRVAGSQTATVVGPQDQEVWTDKFGRIKVHFHWDRHGQSDGLDSCWVRVATNWAGKGFGFLTLPRVGQEVVVDFLEGDPDQPLVTGSVYNAEQLSPFNLPANRNVTTLKTQTVQGSAGEFHGLAFDDEKDNQRICLRSQRDLVVSAVRNHSTYVPSTHFVQIGNGQMTVVGGLPLPFTAGNGNGEGSGDGEKNDQAANEEPSTHEAEGEDEGSADADWFKWMGVEMEPFPVSVSIDGKFGIELSMVAGIKSYFDFPAATEVVVDPFGFIGGLAAQVAPPAVARLAAAASGLTGETDIVYGNKTELHYGPLVEIRRGPVFQIHEKLKVPTAILAVCHAASVLGTIALPAILSPFKTGPWLKNATSIAYGIATAMQWLTTQLEIRWSKAVAALDAAEEALQKAEQALAQLNLDTVSNFSEQIGELVKDTRDLLATQTEELQKSLKTNYLSGDYRLKAGHILLSAETGAEGDGRCNLSADDNLNLLSRKKLIAHAGDKIAIRGANLTLHCASAGSIHLAVGDLGSMTKIELSPAGITLTCGASSIALTPTEIKLNGLVLDVKAITAKQTAVEQKLV